MRTPKPTRLPLVSVLLLLAAGPLVQLSPGSVHADGEPRALPSSSCPSEIPGTTIIAAALSDGAALLFLARHDVPRDIVELRTRVRAMSAVQNRGAVKPPEAAPVTHKPVDVSDPHEPIATVFDVEDGAMLKLTPSKVDQLADVQARALEYAQRMMGGDCPLRLDQTTPLRSGARKSAAPAGPHIPPGTVPGTGPIDTPAVFVPSLGM